jgi:hypothetical protein
MPLSRHAHLPPEASTITRAPSSSPWPNAVAGCVSTGRIGQGLIPGAVALDSPFPSWPGDSPGHLPPHVVEGCPLLACADNRDGTSNSTAAGITRPSVLVKFGADAARPLIEDAMFAAVPTRTTISSAIIALSELVQGRKIERWRFARHCDFRSTHCARRPSGLNPTLPEAALPISTHNAPAPEGTKHDNQALACRGNV